MIQRGADRIAYSPTGMVAVIALAALGGCGKQQSTSSAVTPQLVSVSPATKLIAPGSSYQFSVTVVPANAQSAVLWSVWGAGCAGAACGSVDSTGYYTAPPLPPSPSTVTLIATSVQDQTRLGEATVTIISSQSTNGDFHAIDSMIVPRTGATATLLQDGRVLISGGEQSGPTAEIYNPATGTFVASNANITGTATPIGLGFGDANITGAPVLLKNGEVLFVDADSAELYDPKTDTTAPTGHMLVNQQVWAAIVLASGKALVLGNHDAEIYDPANGSFSLAGPYAASLYDSPVVGLADGRVMILGSNPPQLFDPAANSFSLTGSLSGTALDGVDSLYSSTLLQDGRVLVAGGSDGAPTNAAVIYDPANGKFSNTASMNDARDGHAAVRLVNGRVLVLGGDGWSCSGNSCYFTGSLASAELYDSATASFSRTGNMIQARGSPNATLLQNGDVLITGGFIYCGIGCFIGPTASAEIYHPQ